MNRIDQTFATLRSSGRRALVGYLTAGDPDFDASLAIVQAAVAAGLDVLELGVPFSDPIADGPTIQRASYVALEHGLRLEAVFELATRLRAKHPGLPTLLFTAYNPIFHAGEAAFVRPAVQAGVDGLKGVRPMTIPCYLCEPLWQNAPGTNEG